MSGRFFDGREVKCHYWDGKTDYKVRSMNNLESQRNPVTNRRKNLEFWEVAGAERRGAENRGERKGRRERGEDRGTEKWIMIKIW